MFNRLIKTEKDYNFALSRIEGLMDAKKNTPEADELELLATLVEMYEDDHYPMDLPDPVDALKFRMEQLGLNQQGLVPFIGSRSKVSEVLNRKKPLTLAMMRALHNGLGIPADVFLRESGADFPDSMPDVDWTRFPVVEMAKRCWLPKVDDIKEAEELMRALINRAGGFQTVSAVLFRKGTSARYNAKTDIYALTAWCLRILSLAREVALDHKYIKGSLNAKALRDIAKLSYFDNGPLLAKEYLNKQGIHLIVASHLARTYLDGAAMLLPDGTPVVGLTLRYDRIDNFWFCLLHELAHVVKHLSVPGKQLFIDDLDLRGHEAEVADTKEKQADDMAIEAMIPRKLWQQNPIQGKATGPKIQALAEWLKIHPAIIAGRIRFEQKNYKLLSKYVGNKEIRKHFKESCSDAI